MGHPVGMFSSCCVVYGEIAHLGMLSTVPGPIVSGLRVFTKGRWDPSIPPGIVNLETQRQKIVAAFFIVVSTLDKALSVTILGGLKARKFFCLTSVTFSYCFYEYIYNIASCQLKYLTTYYEKIKKKLKEYYLNCSL